MTIKAITVNDHDCIGALSKISSPPIELGESLVLMSDGHLASLTNGRLEWSAAVGNGSLPGAGPLPVDIAFAATAAAPAHSGIVVSTGTTVFGLACGS